MNILPLVTIGIPVYNCERFIELAVKSVLNQTYVNFELIITDDGSTDKTLEILKRFDDPRIILIADGENHGIAFRLNQQINMAKGKYFVRMDGDDVMFPDRVAKQIEFLEEHQGTDAIGSKAIIIDRENNVIGIRGQVRNILGINDLFISTRFMHPTVAGTTDWFRQWKYREKFSGCEDMDLWIRSFNRSCFCDLDEPLMFYRDPLHFKLKTYAYRQIRILKCAWALRKYMEGYGILFYCIIKCLSSFLIALVVHITKKDSVMIARRNQSLENRKYYQTLIDSIVSI